MDTKMSSLTTALTTAINGARKQEVRVVDAANDINATMVAAQNRLSAATADPRAELPAPTDTLAASAPSGDIVGPLVSLIEAKIAYAANLKVAETASDMTRQTTDKLGKIRDVQV